jgi:c-di-GMP-binding flagellar brake protein YcgR
VAKWHQSKGPSSETLQALRECTTLGAPVILMSPELGVVYDARLTSVSDENIILDVPVEEIEALPEESWCVISFSHKGSAQAIFAIVQECFKRSPPQLCHLVLQISSDIFGVQPRSAYRIPIKKEADLHVRISTPGGRAWMVSPVNLSLTGILVEFTGEDPNIGIGTQVRVELMLGSNIAVLSGEVKRHHKQQYALSFSDVAYERALLPPESLRTIVHALDRS